jgi:hypothetical protein
MLRHPAGEVVCLKVAVLIFVLASPCCRSALVFEPQVMAYVPCGKEWIKKKAFTHLRRMADQAGR